VATLAAGLGGIGLKDHFDTRRDKAQRRREAYAALMLNLDELIRSIGAPQTISAELRNGTLGEAIAAVAGNVQRTYFAVYLSGSPRVQPLAGTAWDAAWKIHDWITADHSGMEERQALDQLEDLRGKLRKASAAFANAARNETAGLRSIRTAPPATTAGNQAGENAPAPVASLIPFCRNAAHAREVC
jgi:hypothetical protein